MSLVTESQELRVIFAPAVLLVLLLGTTVAVKAGLLPALIIFGPPALMIFVLLAMITAPKRRAKRLAKKRLKRDQLNRLRNYLDGPY